MQKMYLNKPQKLWTFKRLNQYKQIKVLKQKNLLLLTNMAGRKVSIFKVSDFENNLDENIYKIPLPLKEISFKHQVVEIETAKSDRYAFFSLTDFGKEGLRDKVVCIDLEQNYKKVFSVYTKGKWSKVMRYHPDNFLLVSNWHSNDISVIDLKDFKNPKVSQVLQCGKSPRGIAITSNGKDILVTGFHSGDLTFIKYNNQKRSFKVESVLKPFDNEEYQGNMRHVVIDQEDKYAYISNLGRNLVHKIELKTKTLVDSFPVGTSPNTIVLSDNQRYLAVSCRDSNILCILRANDGCLRTIVDTGMKPTGLDFVYTGSNLYTTYNTNFADDSVVCNKLLLS